ncbi:MAG: Gfo/Idh/MocA family oxidoreductase [Alphaproteobacteria bacterium]|nr:Gfo/Idh/MocA family oxidoreductase [Alphaproteobacteria bacterium]
MLGLKAGIIGLGVGERHIPGYQADPRCQVAALCDSDPTKLAEVAARHPGPRTTCDAADILNDPAIGVVSIASHDNDHCKQVLAAIAAGKHIFVEKPLCLLDSEFDAIAGALAANPHIKLSSNLILRRTPRFIELRRRIQAGEMGTPYYMEGDYDYGRVHKILTGWRAGIPFYSVVHGGAIHLIDLLLWLTGGRVVEAFAYGNRIAAEGTPFRHDDLVAALLKFEDGKTAKVTANFPSVVPHHHRLSVYGTQATFEQSHTGAAYFHSRDPAAMPEAVTDAYPGAAKGDMLPSFIAHVLDNGEPEVTKSNVLDAMAVSLAIQRSLASGQPEKIRYAVS